MIEQQYGGKHSVFYFLIVLFSLFLFYPYEFVSVYMPFMPMKEYVIAAFVFIILVFTGLISSKTFKIEALPFRLLVFPLLNCYMVNSSPSLTMR